MAGVRSVPWPVLGTVKTGGLPALLHKYTLEKNVQKMDIILRKGVDVDCVNHLGQTALFCASFLGFTSVVKRLLHYGANPNHRGSDRSTPVHAGVFSCDPWLLSSLLYSGGDLRLHDDQGRTPKDWAEAGTQENSPRMLVFLQECQSEMQSLSQLHLPIDVQVTSLKTLQCTAFGFGYGKLLIGKPGQGLVASVPLISDTDLSQADVEPFTSFTHGFFISMTNCSWKGCHVTVKALQSQMYQLRDGQDGLLDLLITEQEYCCQLSHQHLLQLMAVSMSSELDRTRLVYERVHVGSLFSLLHEREAFPHLQMVDLLSVVLQVCEVLMYLSGQSLVLRALSSHTVLLVHPGVAKVTGLGFMVPSEGSCPYTPPPIALPSILFNWAAPEVMMCTACTWKADLYSMCALIQEIFTDNVPWGGVDPCLIKQSVEAGQALETHPAVPQPYYQILQNGLQLRPQQRTGTLLDLCYNLRCDIKEMRSKSRRRNQWSVDDDIQMQLRHLDSVMENETKDRMSHNLSAGIHKDEGESTTDTDDLHWDIPHHDVNPLDEWSTSHYSSLSELSSSICGDTEKDQAVSCSILRHIGSIILNLKVSQVFLQQAKRSLDNAEAARASVPCFDEVDAGRSEAEKLMKEKENRVWKAVEPLSRNYIPKWSISGDEEASQYFLAYEESFDSAHCHKQDDEEKNLHLQEEHYDLKTVEGTEREQQRTGLRRSERTDDLLKLVEPQKDSTHRSWESSNQTKPAWTGEVSELVAQMAHGCLGSKLDAVGSSDSEDFEEQWFHLLGWQEHNSRFNQESEQTTSETPESTDLEHLFKCFAGIQSESEESLCTVNRTFDVISRALEATSQTEEEGSSPDLPSSLFFTPKNQLENSTAGEEHPESLSSEEDLDVTVEVCRPSTTPPEKNQTTVNSPSGIQSESEESTDFCTVNRTFDETSRALEATSQTEKEGSSPDLPSSLFFTPKNQLENSTAGEEHPESLSSEKDLDVTVEVCRPSTTPPEKNQTTVNSPSDYHPAQEDSKETEPDSITSAPKSISISCLPDLADFADLSSISCSPAHQQEWVGPDGAPPTSHSRGHPPCNSTPRSPRSHRTHLRDVQVNTELLPHLQSPLNPSAWSRGESSTTDASVSSVLQSPAIRDRDIPQEETDSPTSGNAEFTTASSEVRHTTETSQGNSGQTEGPIDRIQRADVTHAAGTPSESEAHSSLDEVLEVMWRDSAGQRTPKLPGPISPPITEVREQMPLKTQSASNHTVTEQPISETS